MPFGYGFKRFSSSRVLRSISNTRIQFWIDLDVNAHTNTICEHLCCLLLMKYHIKFVAVNCKTMTKDTRLLPASNRRG